MVRPSSCCRLDPEASPLAGSAALRFLPEAAALAAASGAAGWCTSATAACSDLALRLSTNGVSAEAADAPPPPSAGLSRALDICRARRATEVMIRVTHAGRQDLPRHAAFNQMNRSPHLDTASIAGCGLLRRCANWRHLLRRRRGGQLVLPGLGGPAERVAHGAASLAAALSPLSWPLGAPARRCWQLRSNIRGPGDLADGWIAHWVSSGR